MVRILLRAVWIGCLGMLLAMLASFAIVAVILLFDPKCGRGDSGGCAMGLVSVTLGAAIPGFVIGFAGHLSLVLWRRRPTLPTIRQLRNWGRED
jgi:ABC-type Fe3+ transport system permease subunit